MQPVTPWSPGDAREHLDLVKVAFEALCRSLELAEQHSTSGLLPRDGFDVEASRAIRYSGVFPDDKTPIRTLRNMIEGGAPDPKAWRANVAKLRTSLDERCQGARQIMESTEEWSDNLRITDRRNKTALSVLDRAYSPSRLARLGDRVSEALGHIERQLTKCPVIQFPSPTRACG